MAKSIKLGADTYLDASGVDRSFILDSNTITAHNYTVKRFEGDFTTSASGNINLGIRNSNIMLGFRVERIDTAVTLITFGSGGNINLGLHLTSITSPFAPIANETVHVVFYTF